MIKGLTLGITASIFIVSLIFFLAFATNSLNENIITGASVKEPVVVAGSIAGLMISFIFFLVIFLVWRRNSRN